MMYLVISRYLLCTISIGWNNTQISNYVNFGVLKINDSNYFLKLQGILLKKNEAR